MDIVRDAIHDIIASGRIPEWLFKLKLLKSDELRICLALTAMKCHNIIPSVKKDKKSNKESIKIKNDGNRIYISNKDNEEYFKAWELYSKSIAIAPNGSQALALAYANRSAVLMKLTKFSESIEDINRALKLDYPVHLREKLLCRKAECLAALGKLEIEDMLDDVKLWLVDVKLNDDEEQNFLKKLKSYKNQSIVETPQLNSKNKCPTFISDNHIPCASEAITLKYDTVFGTHLRTTRKVEAGEILIVEKPYAAVLRFEDAYTHCHHCLQFAWALIPCECCIYAMYCSEECKQNAWKEYHDIECPVAGSIPDIDSKNADPILLSMRLLILAMKKYGSVSKLRKVLDDNYKDQQTTALKHEEYSYSNTYLSVYSLITNSEKRLPIDIFERALKAAFVLYYLVTLSPLMGEKLDANFDNLVMNEDVTFIGGLILRHQQIIPSNAHSVEEVHLNKSDTCDIGAAILPFCSFINHSCEPNVTRCSTPQYFIIYALYPIEKDMQIFDNYGIHYALMNKADRQRKLIEQYYFKCECIACMENWVCWYDLPHFDKLLHGTKRTKVRNALAQFDYYFKIVSEGHMTNVSKVLADLKKMIEILLKYTPMPCKDLNMVVETFKRAFSLKYMNIFEIPKLQ